MSLATTVTLTAKNVAVHLEDFLKRFRYLGYWKSCFLKPLNAYVLFVVEGCHGVNKTV